MHSARPVGRVRVFTALKLQVAWALILRPIVHDGMHGGFCSFIYTRYAIFTDAHSTLMCFSPLLFFFNDCQCVLSEKCGLSVKIRIIAHPVIDNIGKTLVALRDGINLSDRNKILHTTLYHGIDKNSDPARKILETFAKWTTLVTTRHVRARAKWFRRKPRGISSNFQIMP